LKIVAAGFFFIAVFSSATIKSVSDRPKSEVITKGIKESCFILKNELEQKESDEFAWVKPMVFPQYHLHQREPGQHPRQFLLHLELARWMDPKQAGHQSTWFSWIWPFSSELELMRPQPMT
jgi:hypothetical protein